MIVLSENWKKRGLARQLLNNLQNNLQITYDQLLHCNTAYRLDVKFHLVTEWMLSKRIVYTNYTHKIPPAF